MSKKKTLPPFNEEELSLLAARFKLLGEPMRLKILEGVCHEPRTVNEIVELVESTQANVSKHLSLLANGGIVERKKEGQFVYYSLKDTLVLQLCSLVRSQFSK